MFDLSNLPVRPEPAAQDDPQGRAELAIEAGFAGTFEEFYAWLKEHAINGEVNLETAVNDLKRFPVETAVHGELNVLTIFDGGFSTSERLAGLLRRGPLGRYLVRSERMLDTYAIPVSHRLLSSSAMVWIKPRDERALLEIRRAVTLEIVTADGEPVTFKLPDGFTIRDTVRSDPAKPYEYGLHHPVLRLEPFAAHQD